MVFPKEILELDPFLPLDSPLELLLELLLKRLGRGLAESFQNINDFNSFNFKLAYCWYWTLFSSYFKYISCFLWVSICFCRILKLIYFCLRSFFINNDFKANFYSLFEDLVYTIYFIWLVLVDYWFLHTFIT